MSLKRRYVKTLRRQFKQAPVWPQNEVLRLGEYGLYSNGRFTSFGNIFEELGLDVNDYLSDDVETKSSFLYQSEKTNRIVAKTDLGNGKYKVDVKFNFDGTKECVLQLYKYDSESISLKPDLISALIANLENLGWRKKYRIVVSRIIAEDVRFAYSYSRNASLELSAETDVPNLKIAELNLGYERSAKVSAEIWLDSGEGTPLVNLVKFERKGLTPVQPLFTMDTTENEFLIASDEPILVVDNTDADFDIDNVEDSGSEPAIMENNGYGVA